MRLGVKSALVDGRIVGGDVSVDDGRVAAVGVSPAGAGGFAVPGFVDVQINGFDGVDFTTAGPDDYDYLNALRKVQLVSNPRARVIGVHLEGPFLAPNRCGAHDPENMVNPDKTLAKQFLEAGPFTYATVAPELPGALDLIKYLTGAGVVVALGHTDADAATAHAAFDRGARSVTHIFGAQTEIQASPGPPSSGTTCTSLRSSTAFTWHRRQRCLPQTPPVIGSS
jgi:N-acetylglucosamine-6-phosphate deacetylase